MEFFHGLGKELCLQSLDMASVVVTNPQKTLQVLYERDGNEFLCILKQYGAKTNSEEAIRLSPKEYVDNFRKCVKEKWVFLFFKETKAITGKVDINGMVEEALRLHEEQKD